MRAWVCRATGYPNANPEGFKLEDDFPTPVPAAGQLLIRVRAVALNPAGWKTMALAPFTWFMKRPGVPEPEFSGEVAGGAFEQAGFALGDEVFGISPFSFWKGQGALAEYTVVDAANVVRKPATLSHAEASALPVALLTPYWSLVTIGGLKHGQRVFINGGSGGVGTGAVQLAKALGAHVTSTSSPSSSPLLTSLGADTLVDYRAVRPSLPSYLAEHFSAASPLGFDLILDCIGINELYAGSEGYLRSEGVFLNVGGAPLRGWRDVGRVLWDLLDAVGRPGWMGGVRRKYRFIQTPPEMTGLTLKAVFEFVATGQVKAVIDSEFAYEDAVKAYDRITSDRAKGKVVVHVR